jgi:predicted GTPase
MTVQHVLVPLDFSTYAEQALDYAIALAKQLPARVTLLHVIQPPAVVNVEGGLWPFLCCYRDDPQTEVVAFTAARIPSIAGRHYPASLAGPYYPDGMPMYPETDLEALLAASRVDEVVSASSDVANQTRMTIAQTVLAAGVPCTLLGPHATMLASQVPVITVCAVRNGCGTDAVVFGTPVDLRRLLTLYVPAVRVSYSIEAMGQPTLAEIIPLLTTRAGARLSQSLPR